MTIHERLLDDITVLDLEGPLSLESNAQFRIRVASAIDAGTRKLVVNMEKVSYMDSSGLGEIIACYARMQQVSGRLTLLHLNDRLRYLLVITKLVSIFETYDSEPAAIESFHGNTSAMA